MNFSDRSNISKEFSFILPKRNFVLVTSTIDQLLQLQLNDGSFEMNDNIAKLFSIDENYFENLKEFFVRQGFNSFGKKRTKRRKMWKKNLFLFQRQIFEKKFFVLSSPECF